MTSTSKYESEMAWIRRNHTASGAVPEAQKSVLEEEKRHAKFSDDRVCSCGAWLLGGTWEDHRARMIALAAIAAFEHYRDDFGFKTREDELDEDDLVPEPKTAAHYYYHFGGSSGKTAIAF